MRVVLDANVIVSALLSRVGAPAALLAHWFAGEFDLVVSERLLGEVERISTSPKIAASVEDADARLLVSLLRERAELALDPESPPPLRSADPDDDYLIALAAQEQAIVVSGDQHLLALADRAPVLTPRELVTRLEA